MLRKRKEKAFSPFLLDVIGQEWCSIYRWKLMVAAATRQNYLLLFKIRRKAARCSRLKRGDTKTWPPTVHQLLCPSLKRRWNKKKDRENLVVMTVLLGPGHTFTSAPWINYLKMLSPSLYKKNDDGGCGSRTFFSLYSKNCKENKWEKKNIGEKKLWRLIVEC